MDGAGLPIPLKGSIDLDAAEADAELDDKGFGLLGAGWNGFEDAADFGFESLRKSRSSPPSCAVVPNGSVVFPMSNPSPPDVTYHTKEL